MFILHNIIFQFVDLMDGLIPNKEDAGILSKQHLEKLVVFAIMWSVGALLELVDRAKMEEYMKENCGLNLPKIEEGSGDTIFEYCVDADGNMCSNFNLFSVSN